jgi:protein-arginine kinase
VKSVEISVSRNVEGYPFAAIMKLEHYEEIAQKLANAVKCLCTGDIKGKLFPLDGISDDARKSLTDAGMYCRNDDDELKSANAARFWPQGRAIYANDARNFFVWCNRQDHFKFIACDSCGNLSKIAFDTTFDYNPTHCSIFA